MKRSIIIICTGLLMALPIVAQEFRPGVLAGLNLNVPSNLESRLGFHVGVKGELALPTVANGLYAESGLILSSLPWKSEKHIYPKIGIVSQTKATPYYLNIPLRAGFKWNCGRIAKFFVNAGPYLNIGLFGNIKDIQRGVNNEPLPWSNDDPGYFKYVGSNHRVDWGLGFPVCEPSRSNLLICSELIKVFLITSHSLCHDWQMSGFVFYPSSS